MAIELIVSDVDGTMTDGSVWYGKNGDRYCQFSTLDGEGISMWKNAGKQFVMASKSQSEEIVDRADWLDVNFFGGVQSKWELLSTLSNEMGLDAEQICFMGNDVPDIPALIMCGYPACPKDAHPDVLVALSTSTVFYVEKPHFISTERGGHGAVRHLIDWLMLNSFEAANYAR